MTQSLQTTASRQRVEALAAQMLERERWPRARLLDFQRRRLRETVQHAVANSPYYRGVIGDPGSDEIDLQQLPVLTKTTLMAEFDRIVTDRRLRLADAERHLAGERAGEPLLGEYRVVASGGTTGERAVVVYDQPAWEIAVASLLRLMNVQGISAETRVLGIGAPTPLHMTNRLFAELRVGRADAPRLAVTTPLRDVVGALNAYQPEALITYPSFVRRLAEEQQAGRLRIAPRQFCTAAETLTQDVRDLAREIWGAAVLNAYGATEANLIGIECLWTAGLHVAEDLLVVEVVDENNRPVPPGVAGHKLLVTTLFNRTLPFIRYELSDLVTVADGPCLCGRPHLRLAAVQGRREDVLSLPARNGGRVSVHALELRAPLLRMPRIRQFQVSPRPAGLLIRVVLREASAAEGVLQSARRAIEAQLDQVGADVGTLTIEAVDEIGRAGTGAKEKLVSLAA
ncbi:MAG TPA: AMP-binding protein [Geminicoccaceae bacterium]|jgi:putative adenylate-forming enzyme|nr:AMP-binding protein [Geminicoccaceae bacterium]